MTNANSLRWPDTFLTSFVKDYWDKKPGLFKLPFGIQPFAAKEVFDSIKETVESKKKGMGGQIRFYLEEPRQNDYQPLPTQVTVPNTLLPNETEHDIETYRSRMEKKFPDKKFGVVANNQETTYHLWEKTLPLAQSLAKKLGPPPGGTDLVAFLGNYHRTPAGIHLDDQHVFTFVVEGKKHMRVWPYDTVTKFEKFSGLAIPVIRDRAEYDEIMGLGIDLHGEPGDLMYWPSSYWHCGFSDGSFSMTLTLGFRYDTNMFDMKMGKEILYSVGHPLQEIDLDLKKMGRTIPKTLAKSMKNPRAIHAQIQDELARKWLHYATAQTYVMHPTPRKSEGIHADDTIVLENDPILAVSLNKKKLAVSTHGQVFELKGTPRMLNIVLDLILSINRSKPVRLSTWLSKKKLAHDNDLKEVLTALLGQLSAYRSIKKVPGNDSAIIK